MARYGTLFFVLLMIFFFLSPNTTMGHSLNSPSSHANSPKMTNKEISDIIEEISVTHRARFLESKSTLGGNTQSTPTGLDTPAHKSSAPGLASSRGNRTEPNPAAETPKNGEPVSRHQRNMKPFGTSGHGGVYANVDPLPGTSYGIGRTPIAAENPISGWTQSQPIPATNPPDQPLPAEPADEEPPLSVFVRTTTEDEHGHNDHNPASSIAPGITGGNKGLEGKIVGHEDTQPAVKSELCRQCSCHENSEINCISNSRQHTLRLDSSLLATKVQTINVFDYDEVWITANTFASPDSRLTQLQFRNINMLNLEPDSLYFSPNSSVSTHVKVTFNNCYIPRIPKEALTQKIEESHENLDILSFLRIRYLTLEFDTCKIGPMEAFALSNARLNSLTFVRSKIESMVRKSIDLLARTCNFLETTIPALPEEALCLHASRALFKRNVFHGLGKKSVAIETGNQVLFQGNVIHRLSSEALTGIEPKEKYGATLNFTSNDIVHIEENALALSPLFDTGSKVIFNNTFHIPCDCNFSETFRTVLGVSSNEESWTFRTSMGSSRCEMSMTYMAIESYLSKECKEFQVVLVSAISVAVVLFIVAVTVCVVCSLRVQQVKEEANMLGDCTSQSFSTLNKNYADDTLRESCDGRLYTPRGTTFAVLPWGVAVPGVKTYQENVTPEMEQTESFYDGNRGTLQGGIVGPLSMQRSSCPFN